jgi:tetratricopeptide (TPR) repeat protein
MRTLSLTILVAGVAFSQGPETLDPVQGAARSALNEGVVAFKSARYADAVSLFEKAVRGNPQDKTARLYLATALMSQYIPGAESAENMRFANRAEAEFGKVLELDPKNTIALESLASLLYSQAQGEQKPEAKRAILDRAAGWYKRVTEADPQKKEAYYSLGVIAWAKFYPALMTARSELGMKPEDRGPLKSVSSIARLQADYGSTIEEAIKNLKRALELDPQYDDAMAYMNLLVRERADLASTTEDYLAGIKEADEWVQKALDAKRVKAEAAAQQR